MLGSQSYLLAPTVLVKKFPANSPGLLSAGNQAINAPPIMVGMIKKIMAVPLLLYRPPHQVPNQTETNATAQPGRFSNRVVYSS